jgi:DNA-binding phage protein
MPNEKVSNEWLGTNLKDRDFRRSFEQELCAEEFITRIEERIKAVGITRSELAQKLQLDAVSIARAFRSPAAMTLASMVDVALVLNLRLKLTLEDLVDDS